MHLADVSSTSWEEKFPRSRWFTRGWTLQELLAPASLTFYSRDGQRLGDKRSLEGIIHDVTRIPRSAFQGSEPLSVFGIDERFGWARNRQTKREEDKAYCIYGIVGITLPSNYGEGRESALMGLRKAIRRKGNQATEGALPHQPAHTDSVQQAVSSCGSLDFTSSMALMRIQAP